MALQAQHKNTIFHVGDTVAIHQKIIEKDKERSQVFEGVVISIKGERDNKMFTVRKIGHHAVGVERIWPLISPWIKKIEIKKRGKVRRAKLYFLRKKKGKQALKVKSVDVAKTKPEGKSEKKVSRKTRRKSSRKVLKEK